MSKSRNWFSIFRVLMVGFLVVAAISVHANFFDKSPEPGSVQIKLSDAGVAADFRFEVKKHLPYWYSISFGFPENDQIERARIRKLLGGNLIDKNGKPLEPGTPTPINLTIFAICKNGKEIAVYSQDVDPILTSWGQNNFVKNIGKQILTSGIYRAHLINKRASPEFSSIPINFEISMSAKVNFDPLKEPTRSEPCQQ